MLAQQIAFKQVKRFDLAANPFNISAIAVLAQRSGSNSLCGAACRVTVQNYSNRLQICQIAVSAQLVAEN